MNPKGVMLVVLLSCGMMVLSGGTLFAKNNHSADEIKILKDSVIALKTSHPDLSVEMSKYAAEEEKEAKAMEPIDDENLNYEEEGLKLLLDASGALKISHPELSLGLAKYADKEKLEISEMKN